MTEINRLLLFNNQYHLIMKVNVIEHDKKKNSHFLVCSDIHEQFIDEPAFSIMLKYARIYNITNLIILGDLLDLDWLMPKNPAFKKWISRSDCMEEFFLPKLEASMDWAIKFFERCAPVFKKIYFAKGNHDARIDEFREVFCQAEYKHHFNFSKIDKYCEDIFENNDWIDLGALSMTHGQFHGPTHFKKHYEASEARNVLIGHVHKDEKICFLSRGKTKQVQSLPCMSTLSPHYLKGRENNWTLGFGYIIIKPSGHYNYYTLNVWDNELALPDGRILK
jgi:hypothetical protein